MVSESPGGGELDAGVEIIAETANAHAGSEAELATLVRLLAAAGADAVKVQLVLAQELCTPDYAHHRTFAELELPEAAWARVALTAADAGVALHLDAFGPRSVAIAESVGAQAIKLHASDTANLALIEAVAATSVRRVLLAVGGARREEIAAALAVLAAKRVVLMLGFQGYPTRIADNQIARIAELRRAFPGVEVGFADHVPFADPARIWLPAVAIGAGATVIEKHAVLSTAARGLDHDAALNPDEFRTFVTNMRLAAAAAAAPGAAAEDFGMAASEHAYRAAMRKSLLASRALAAGTVLTAADLALKRSGHPDAVALDPEQVTGRRLSAAVAADEPIHEGLLAP